MPGRARIPTASPATCRRSGCGGGDGDGGDARSSGDVQGEANRLVLARYSPPGVIVDAEMRIVHFRGQTGAYLEPAPGEASLNLLKMARDGLLYGLRSALHEARHSDRPIRKVGMRVKQDGQ